MPRIVAGLAESDDRGRYDENDQGLDDSANHIAVLELPAPDDEIFTVL
jgi:hypothetical protein